MKLKFYFQQLNKKLDYFSLHQVKLFTIQIRKRNYKANKNKNLTIFFKIYI